MQLIVNIPKDTYEYYVKLANKGEQLILRFVIIKKIL